MLQVGFTLDVRHTNQVVAPLIAIHQHSRVMNRIVMPTPATHTFTVSRDTVTTGVATTLTPARTNTKQLARAT
jgi:hypothetical protein